MKKPFSILALFVFLVSCNKEDGETGPADTMLDKTVEYTGMDSVVTQYVYDGSGRITRIQVTGKQGTIIRNADFIISRDGNGNVTSTVEKTAQLAAAGCDSVLTRFNFTGGRYKYSIITADYSTADIYDSLVYDYDTQGRIWRENHFQTITPGGGLTRYVMDFVYFPGGGLDSVNYRDYDPASGTYTLSNYIEFSFDQKVNPLPMGLESILFYQYPFAGLNNMTGLKATFPANSSFDYLETFAHTYNTNNTPRTSAKMGSNGVNSQISWFYK